MLEPVSVTRKRQWAAILARSRSLSDSLVWGTKSQQLWNARNLLVLMKEYYKS